MLPRCRASVWWLCVRFVASSRPRPWSEGCTCAPSTCVSHINVAVWSESLYTLSNSPRTDIRRPGSPLSVGDVKQLPAICARAGVELLRATGVTTHRCTSFPLQNPAARAGHLNKLVKRYQLSMPWMCLLCRRVATCLLLVSSLTSDPVA